MSNKNHYKYKNGRAIFLKNEYGDEMYLRDEYTGKEIYPKKGPPFAKNRFNKEYYAKNGYGNEYFPMRNKKSVLIHQNGIPIIPRQLSGKQTYPKDDHGNEYYLVDPKNKEPFLLRNENGETYFAKTNSGVTMIPSNYFNENYNKRDPNEKYYLGMDAGRNVVYSEVDLTPCKKSVLGCICAVILTIPEAIVQLGTVIFSILK